MAAAATNGDSQEASSSGETLGVTVTELADANTFYIQVHQIPCVHFVRSSTCLYCTDQNLQEFLSTIVRMDLGNQSDLLEMKWSNKEDIFRRDWKALFDLLHCTLFPVLAKRS